MYTAVQFSSIHHNVLFCNARAERITFFNLLQIQWFVLFQCLYEKDKSETLSFTAGPQISQGNKNLP